VSQLGVAAGPVSWVVRRRRASGVARLRYSRAEAQAEATRRAEAFVADRPDREQFWHRITYPDRLVPPSRASKHPVAWVAVFQWEPPDGSSIDGCELFVIVDLEAGTVGLRHW
jgi:hypothetical protein